MWDSVSSSRPAWGVALLALLLVAAAPAHAKVFHSRSEALEIAFPEADRVEDETVVLDDAQTDRIQSLARSELESRLVRIYRGFKDDRLLGYAVIDIHNVRTLPEAFLVVLSPEGSVRSLRVLAFHEPLEYMPSARWYGQFAQKSLSQPLRLGSDVHGIVGATLSARATTRGVRRALALYEVVIQNGR
jgi:Na+-translocating ferredoxin:NAD+ oxidoreductase RnfG subunit